MDAISPVALTAPPLDTVNATVTRPPMATGSGDTVMASEPSSRAISRAKAVPESATARVSPEITSVAETLAVKASGVAPEALYDQVKICEPPGAIVTVPAGTGPCASSSMVLPDVSVRDASTAAGAPPVLLTAIVTIARRRTGTGYGAMASVPVSAAGLTTCSP